MRAAFGLLAVAASLCLVDAARAAETDQYLVWNVELRDSADEVNGWLNAELAVFLEKVNTTERLRNASADELAIHFLRHVFDVRPFAHINELYNSGALDEFPPREEVNFLRYQRMSIYRGPAFPFLLFMARTIRIGEVYLGIDKLSHFFGYGRRYFVNAIKLEQRGFDDETILRRLIEGGLRDERWLTGRAVNGVISRSDLEANYQGFRFAQDLCRGDSPVIALREGQWVQLRPLDIVPYITPQFDESYYPNLYWSARKRRVEELVARKYGHFEESPLVQQRFARYDCVAPSLNVTYVDTLLREDATE